MTGTEVNSKVYAATVFRGRALITREVKLDLAPGEHSLIFPELPANMDRNSIQVSGTGEAVLGGCVFETEHLVCDVNQQASELLIRQQELTDEVARLELKKIRLQGEKTFVEKIATFVTTPQQTEGTERSGSNNSANSLNVDLWKNITGFYSERQTALDSETLEISRKNREIQKELKKTTLQLQSLGHRKTRSRDIVKVNVSKETQGELTLHLSYVVPGPSWKPVYNLRSEENSENLALEYDALVTQATGEDWNDIDLKLSTARISVSGAIPTLDPWRISFYSPPARPVMSNARAKRKSAKPPEEMYDMAEFSAGSAAEEIMPAPQPMAVQEASVEETGSSALFKVAGAAEVTGDNRETRVVLTRMELPAEYLFRSVPKLIQFAYRTAQFTNTSSFPILPGAANIYHNGSLVSTSVFELIMPDQKADVSLGVDEGIKVEYQFIKKFRKNEGLLNKRTSMQFEYCVKLENNTGREALLEVMDQFPISQDKDLEVKPVQPEISKNNEEISMNEQSKITWHLKLTPGEKCELPLAYIVEYPVDRTLEGL